jgi:iron complex transport system permease protein
MSAILGAVTLLTCDLLLNLIPGGRSLPINAVTAALGAPVVAWVILRNQRAWTI